ncbi:MAG: cysteine hydrolase, partial [Actinomycetota bacterium]|nr:cysteine hydrolase [Actinomycetota bacterium]
AAATATRSLPNGNEAVPAAHVQAASLAALSDLPGIVVPDHTSVPD